MHENLETPLAHQPAEYLHKGRSSLLGRCRISTKPPATTGSIIAARPKKKELKSAALRTAPRTPKHEERDCPETCMLCTQPFILFVGCTARESWFLFAVQLLRIHYPEVLWLQIVYECRAYTKHSLQPPITKSELFFVRSICIFTQRKYAFCKFHLEQSSLPAEPQRRVSQLRDFLRISTNSGLATQRAMLCFPSSGGAGF
jgi:hypothetical protein